MAALPAGDVNRAGEICDGLLLRGPDNAEATYVSGLIHYQRNQIKPAIEALARAITLDPGSAEYHRSLATIFKNTGAAENAVRFYEQALLRDPDDALTHVLLAEAFKDLGDIESALTHYHHGVRLDPDDPVIPVHIDKLEMVIAVSRALLAPRDDGQPAVCDLGDTLFGRPVALRLPQTSIDFTQAYKSNLDTLANAYNAVGLAGAFGDQGAILPHYLAEWIYDDYLSIREHLSKKVTNILDIGCGFGGLAALLQVHYAPETTPHFHLVEQARIPGAEFSRPTPDAPDLDPLACAAELLIANGVADAQVHTIASDNAKALYKNKYDLIVSMRSWCYLYPIETYIEVVRTALRPGGTFLVDVHKNLGGLAALCAYLPDATLVSERQDLVRCLYVKTS